MRFQLALHAVRKSMERPDAGTSAPLALVAEWDGSKWNRVLLPAPAASGSGLQAGLVSVSCVTDMGCTAVGWQTSDNNDVALSQSDMAG
jgi:hypothetical protein